MSRRGRRAPDGRGGFRAWIRIAVLAFLALTVVSGPVRKCRAQPARSEAPADLFYLHPLVNYAIPIRWQDQWERQRLQRGGLQSSVGSISTKDLATRVEVEVTEPVSPHLRFLYRLDWNESPHVDGPEQQNWLGVEVGGFGSPLGQVGFELVVNPASDKGDLDVAPGLVWTSAGRTDYLRVSWRRDDFVWEDKNELGGVRTSEARGPVWATHLSRGRWRFSSAGAVLAPDERSFPDQDSSPALASTSLERSWSSTALRYQRGAALFELRFEHRDFAEILVARGLADAESDSTSVSRLTHFRIAWEHQLDAEWRTRVLTSRVRYDHDLDEFRHRRHDTMFGLFVERALGWGNWVDVGYLGTAFDWHTDPPGGPYEDDRDGFASKVSLGWTLEVEGRGWLRALLSHEPDPQQFGGASVMAQVLF